MPKYHLTEKQKRLLRSIVPGLKDGRVKPEWRLLYGDDRIMAIFGLDDDGSLWREVWNEVSYADFEMFERNDFFISMRTDRYGMKVGYVLNEALIIDAVENDFAPTKLDETGMAGAPNPRQVFVIHGRNMNARNAMFNFLRAVDLRPIEWAVAVAKTSKGSPYVGEVLDIAFSEAQAVVALLTPDDEARLHPLLHKENEEPHETQLTLQARQNVVFEAGMAIGLKPDKTIIVELGRTRQFSDILGRHVIRLDDSSEKRQELLLRLKNAGCPVDQDATDWMHTGEFEKAVAEFVANAKGVHWNRIGNLWWLCSDTIHTAGEIQGEASRNMMIDRLGHIQHHAQELGLEKELIDSIKKLRDRVITSRDEDWTTPERKWLSEQLREFFNAVSQVVQRNQPDFKPHPD